jgi:hypothetical protein
MGFVIESSEGGPLPQAALRRLVEVVDACRGQKQVFVVFRNTSPYQAISVHTTEADAKKGVKAEKNLSYFGPVVPKAAPSGFYGVRKVAGTTFTPLERPAETVVLLDADEEEVARFPVGVEGRLTDPQSDVEALFFTASSVDKYAIPYLTRVFDAEFAAEQRRKWLKG